MHADHFKSVLKRDPLIHSSDEYRRSSRFNCPKKRHQSWKESVQSPTAFWAKQASAYVDWHQKWQQVFKNEGSHRYRWFSGATLNVSENCLDRHLTRHPDKKALIWEGESGEIKRYSFQDLTNLTASIAKSLRSLGATLGDCITIYMPLIPEAIASMLACARIGAVHNVVFAGYSSQALASRVRSSQSKFILTADYMFRGAKKTPLYEVVQTAVQSCPQVEHIIVKDRTGSLQFSQSQQPKTYNLQNLIDQSLANPDIITSCDSENPLFLMYTSGSTGTPKGLVHTSGGYLTQVATSFQHVFEPKPADIFWCTADIGWITSHSYLVYGPLSAGQTIFIYEGAPSVPGWDRFWQIIQRHQISTLYTAPTAIRSFMQHGTELIKPYDLSSLKLLGSVGESISPEVWKWYYKEVGQERCPVVDTWWQTETGSIMLSTFPGSMPAQPGSAGKPLFGIQTSIRAANGEPVQPGTCGDLTIDQPWPSLARTIQGDHNRYITQYWSRYPGVYQTGDAAIEDQLGYIRILGRTDDVINVSGHRICSMEIESILLEEPNICEAAVVGVEHPIKGTAIHIFAIPNQDSQTKQLDIMTSSLKQRISQKIGRFALPEKIYIWQTMPKTRSGKIMRRILREYALGNKNFGDTPTMDEPEKIIAKIKEQQPQL